MKRTIIGLVALLGTGLNQAAFAQGSYVDDALLYSRQGPAGSARTLGLAGANVALGGDWGSVSANPAGLGFFTRSELTFSPSLGLGQVNAAPVSNAASLGNPFSLNQTSSRFSVANAGLVFANRRADNDNSSDWRGGAFALGFTRLADFNQSFRYQNQTTDDYSFFQFLREPGGFADYTSPNYQAAVQDIINQDNQQQYRNLDGLAYGNFLTTPVTVANPNGPGTLQRIGTPFRANPITQNELVTTTGSLSQFDLAYGGNYRDQLYLGFGVGITSLNRTRNASFSERSAGAEDFNFQDNVATTGTGINARLGLIYRATDAVRFGLSAQTPTYMRLTDNYSTTLTASSRYVPPSASGNTISTVPGTYDYSITTPFRANGGVAVLLSKYGFLTGDVEYLNYGGARFNTVNSTFGGGDFSFENSQIQQAYRRVFNLRFGAEGRFDIFRARLGYARYANPFAGTGARNGDRAQNYFTGGLGLRTNKFFLDGAAVYLADQDRYSPYSLAPGPGTVANGVSPVIALDRSRVTVSLTGGLIF